LGAQTALAALPVVGADGLLALGGSITMANEEYDSFVQAHLITDEPRTGVLAALALGSGDPTPEDWVPHDVASYQTIYWDFDNTRQEVATLYDSFRGAEAFQKELVDRASEFLGVDLLEDVIDAMDGRLSLSSWFTRPARINGVAYLGGIRLKADNEFAETLARIVEHTDNNLEQKTYAGFTIYFTPKQELDETAVAVPFQKMQLVFGVVDDYLLIANGLEFIERAIAARSNSAKSLENELDFKLIASKLRRQPGGKTPGRFVFERPEEGLRMLYELATAESTRASLAKGAEGNELLGKLNKALNDNPLPPFATLKKYLAPTGSMIIADEKGFHYVGFGLRRKQ
jgi:hypothetical protein